MNLREAQFHATDFVGNGRSDIGYEYEENGDRIFRVYSQDPEGDFERIMSLNLGAWKDDDKTLIADVNGDGLTDLVRLRKSDSNSSMEVQVAYSTGEGFVWGDWSTLHDWHDNARQFLSDVTGDGRAELITASPNQSGDAVFRIHRLNNATGDTGEFNESPVFIHTTNHSHGGQRAQVIPAEFSGTGKGGFYHLYRSGGGDVRVRGYAVTGERADLLSVVVRGNKEPEATEPQPGDYAEKTTISYRPITDNDIYMKESGAQFPVIDFQGPMYVVSKLAKDDGFDGEYITDYTYAGARIDVHGRGFLGFRVFESFDRQTNILAIEQVAQDFPLTGMVQSTETYYMPDPEDFESAQLLGMVTNTLGFDGWESIGGVRYFPYIAESTAESWELIDGEATSLPHSVVTTISRFDNQPDTIAQLTPDDPSEFPGDLSWGNLRKMVVDYGDGYTMTTVNEYHLEHSYTDDWLLGRLKKTVVTHSNGNPGDDIVRTSEFGYDSSTGLLEWEEVEPDHVPSGNDLPLDLRTTYERDGFGNIKKTIISSNDPNIGWTTGEHTFVTEDKGRWARFTENTLQHEEERRYDPRFGGVTKLVGPNNLPTEWIYDEFGRVEKKIGTDGIEVTTVREWDSTSITHPEDSTLDQQAFYRVIVTQAGGDSATAPPPVTTYYDRLGRTIRTETLGGSGQLLCEDTFYNRLGRLDRVSESYYEGDTIYYIVTEYDELGRQSVVTAPDGTITEHRYEGLVSKTIRDSNLRSGSGSDAPKHQMTTTMVDAKGQTVEIIDPAGKAVTFEYDPSGSLLKTIDPDNTVTQIQYDIRGNKKWMSDPNMGNWEYWHNALGQLVWQKDALDNVTEMEYDELGRMTKRTIIPSSGPSEVSEWRYDGDGPYGWKGALRQEIGANGDRKAFYYDELGRNFLELIQIEEKWYYAYTRYDDWGRVRSFDRFWRPKDMEGPQFGMHYAWHSFGLRYTYNAQGYLEEIRDGNEHAWWKSHDDYDAQGRAWRYQYGNNLEITNTYDPETHMLERIRAGEITGSVNSHQDWKFVFDRLGNLREREDFRNIQSETFSYDNLNRFTHRNNVAVANYNDAGNIEWREGIGNYSYGANGAGPHAVTSANGVSYTYDNAGNMLQRGSGSITWTPFHQVKSVSSGNATVEFAYGVNHNRTVQWVQEGSQQRKKIYVAGGFEQDRELIDAGTQEERWETVRTRLFVSGPSGVIGVYTLDAENGAERHYFHKDHLGSIVAVGDVRGALPGEIVEEYSFDAWGQRRDPTDWDQLVSASGNPLTDRGFTGHEMLDAVGLVHMNGRLYDPVLGRMISADPFVPQPGNLQSYNRYSYVSNNPLSYVDPSGYFLKKLAKGIKKFYYDAPKSFISKNWQPIVTVALAATGQYWALVIFNTAVGYHYGGARGAAIGFASSVTAVAIGIGFEGAAGFMEHAAQAYAHGLSSAGFAAAGGGDLGAAFLAGFAGSAGGSIVGSGVSQRITNGNVASNTVAIAIVGGTASKLGGGKFTNGAATASATYALRQMYYGKLSHEGEIAADYASRPYDGGDTGATFAELGVDYTPDSSRRFFAALYRGDDGRYYLSFRGTHRWGDWLDNVGQAFGLRTSQYEQAINLARAVHGATDGNVVFVGHSLGGGLAAAAAYATGGDAITFNAAGLNWRYRRMGSPGSIRNYSIHGDVLTFGQGVIPVIPRAVGSQTAIGANSWARGMLFRHKSNNFVDR